MATKLSKNTLNLLMHHNGVEITVGQCIGLAEGTADNTELQPYLNSLLFFAFANSQKDLFRECQRLKTIHGARPFSLPVNQPPQDDDDDKDTFIDRVKAIVNKAATKNGERIKTNAKGVAGEYKFYINANAFSAAMEQLALLYPDKLEDYLGGDLYNVNLNKVAPFIGRVIDKNVINTAQSIQRTDLYFAFEDYYKKKNSVIISISKGSKSHKNELLFNIFEMLLKQEIKRAEKQ